MRKKSLTILLAIVTSMGLSYADPVGLQVTEFDVPGTWADDLTPITASDLPGFVAVSYAEAGTWNAAPTDDVVDLIFAFNDTIEGINITYFTNGVWKDEVLGGPMTRKGIYLLKLDGYRLFYTVGAPTPSWVRNGDDWDNATKTLTVNSDLEESAYNGKTEIQHVIISNGVTSIGQTAFNNCFNLSSVTIPNSVTSIGMMAFGSCEKLSSVTIPNGVTRIEGSTFASCYILSSVTIPNSVTIIKEMAFESCFGLTSIEIPNSVDSIGMMAFAECNGLTSVTIPSSVTFIDMMAFMYCDNLTTVTCEAVTPPTLGDKAFDKSPLLAHIYVPAGSVSAYKSAWSAYEALIEANPVLPTIYVNGEWDWSDIDAFTDNGDGTASYNIHLSTKGSNRAFKIRVGNVDWRSNGQTFDPEHTSYSGINSNCGSDMKIYVDAEADYTFTWTYAENKLEITHPVVPDYTVMTKVDPENPDVHYSTFYSSNYSYKLMNDGTVAFIAKISGSDLVLTLIAEGEQVIPAGTAVIFRKTGSSIPVGLRDTQENNTSFDPADNDLEGVNVATPVTDIPGLTANNCYVLSGTAQYGVGFYKIDSDELKQHKAYVKYEGGPNNAPKKMRFVYGQATGIENTSAKVGESEKILENGQLFIIRDGKTYNAMGQIIK
jgi:hypothetical protein